MPPIHLEAQVSPDDLLEAVDQLGTSELDRFVSQVLAIRARRKAPSLPPEEAVLLLQINHGLPAELQERLQQLDDKHASESLTPDEHTELLRLVSEVEALDAQRVESLSHLARLRGVSLAARLHARPRNHAQGACDGEHAPSEPRGHSQSPEAPPRHG